MKNNKMVWNKGLKGFYHSGSFQKGHKTNVGRACSEKTKEKIGIANSIALKGRTLSEEHKEKIRISTSKALKKMYKEGRRKPLKYWLGKKRPNICGEKNGKWIEDRTKLKRKDERNDSAYHDWVKQVKERDNWTCKINNKDCSGYCIVHHILNWSEYPELRYEINNGITLCQAHHPRKRAEEKILIPFFQELVPVSNELF